MFWNVVYIFSLALWISLALHAGNFDAVFGILLGVGLGIQIQRWRVRRLRITSLSGMTVQVHYHDAAGKCQDLERTAPASFANWTPAEKQRWIARAEKDLIAQSERDARRGL